MPASASGQHQPYGWVTIVKDGTSYLSATVERLQPPERLRMEQHWKHFLKMDSERERSRALERDQEREDARQREERTKHHVVPLSKPLSQQANLDDIALAQNVFLQEMATDPNKICFAFGGSLPRTQRSKRKTSRNAYSQLLCRRGGHYQLHVCLRRDSAPLPGSPFALVVAPGDAFPLSTKLPLPLLGVFELFRSEESESQLARCACRVNCSRLLTRWGTRAAGVEPTCIAGRPMVAVG